MCLCFLLITLGPTWYIMYYACMQWQRFMREREDDEKKYFSRLVSPLPWILVPYASPLFLPSLFRFLCMNWRGKWSLEHEEEKHRAVVAFGNDFGAAFPGFGGTQRILSCSYIKTRTYSVQRPAAVIKSSEKIQESIYSIFERFNLSKIHTSMLNIPC